jgi:hypothetical protein
LPSLVPSPTSAKLNKWAIVILGFTIFFTELYFLASSFKNYIFVGMRALGSSWLFNSRILASTFSVY